METPSILPDGDADKARRLPLPTRASVELPDQAAVDKAGIALPLAEAQVVCCALSLFLADGHSKTRTGTYNLIRGVSAVATQDFYEYGRLYPAPHPDLSDRGWRQGATALEHVGITHLDLVEYWRQACDRADDASMPLSWLLEFFAAPVWPAIDTLRSWGPDEAGRRMKQATQTMAKQAPQRTRRRRPDAVQIADSTVQSRVTSTWKLFEVLVRLRGHIAASPTPTLAIGLVDAWTHRPERVDVVACGALPSGQNNSGPPVEECSRRLKQLAAEYRAATSDRRRMRLRRLVMFSLLVLFGARADELRIIRVQDYEADYMFSGGTRGPALRVYPSKTWGQGEAHYLLLSPELAEWLEQWIALNQWQIGQANTPVFPGQNPAKPLTPNSFYTAIAGDRRDGGRALLAYGDDPHDGWHPHAFRHSSIQASVQAAWAFKADNPHRLGHVHPEEFAAAIAGHKLATSISATYRDLDREELVCAVMPYKWALLWDEGVLRRGVNVDRVRQARDRGDVLRVAIAGLDREGRQMTAKSEAAGNQAQRARDEQAKLVLLLEASQYAQLAAGKARDQAGYERELAVAERDYQAAMTTHIPLADDLSEEDYQQRLAQAIGQEVDTPTLDAAPLADEITPLDFADMWGTTEQAVNRWVKDGWPLRKGPCPWQPDAWRTTVRPKRLGVNAIILSLLTEAQHDRLHQVRRRRAHQDGLGAQR
jgi:hypothetical protein